MYRLAEFPGVTVAEVCVPTGERSLDSWEVEVAVEVEAFPGLDAVTMAEEVGLTDADAIGEDSKTEEVCADAGFKDLAFDGVDFELEAAEMGFDAFAGVDQEVSIVAEEGEVIDVTQVAVGFELFGDVVIESVQVDVGEKLAGEVADRDADSFWAGLVKGGAVVEDAIEEPEGVGAFDFAADEGFEDAVVDVGEVAADVGLEDVGVFAGEVGETAEGAVGAFVFAVGVAVEDEGLLEDGLDDVAESVVNDAIAVGGGGNPAGFGFVDFKVTIFARFVGFILEFGLDLD